MWGRAAPEEELSANKLLEPIVQLALWHLRRSVQQFVPVAMPMRT